MLEWWWAYLGLGAFVGFFSGLLGIGGGSATVPVLAFVFAAKGFPQSHVVHLALGTGIAAIVFSSAMSVRSHHLRNAVNWQVLRMMTPGIIGGTFFGALLAGRLDVKVLSIAFTGLMFYFAWQMIRTHAPRPTGKLPTRGAMAAFGATLGFISSLSATGGASIVVPFLVKRNVTIHDAIGTAAAVSWPIAAAGTAGYILGGLHVSDMPKYSLGYVYLPALVLVVIASMLLAPVGAAIAHRTPGRRLRKGFAVLLFGLATLMLLKFI
jgi:uncharacterized membrane protein YfcA